LIELESSNHPVESEPADERFHPLGQRSRAVIDPSHAIVDQERPLVFVLDVEAICIVALVDANGDRVTIRQFELFHEDVVRESSTVCYR
jgi:hypothetical protein